MKKALSQTQGSADTLCSLLDRYARLAIDPNTGILGCLLFLLEGSPSIELDEVVSETFNSPGDIYKLARHLAMSRNRELVKCLRRVFCKSRSVEFSTNVTVP